MVLIGYLVDYEEGSKHKDNLYSSNEWTETIEPSGRKIYRGKWGHRLETFQEWDDEQLTCVLPYRRPLARRLVVVLLFLSCILKKVLPDNIKNEVYVSKIVLGVSKDFLSVSQT